LENVIIKKFTRMFRMFFVLSLFSFIHSWIPLTTVDDNRIKTPICINNKEYFIDETYTIHDTSNKKVKTKVENHMIWFKENSSNRMISEVRNRIDKPVVVEVPYAWEQVMSTLFLSIPYSFRKKQYSTEKINTHLSEINHKKFTLFFEDTIGKTVLNGKVELFSPYLYKLSIREKNEWKVEQLLFLLPVTKEKTRLILYEIDKDDFLHYLKVKKTEKGNHKRIILKWLEKYKST